jgi:hypothetical protein
LTLLLYAGLSASSFFVPFNLIQVQGYSPTAAGAAGLPFIVILSVLSRWAGGLVTRTGPRLPLVIGPAVAGIGFAAFAVLGGGGPYWTTFFPAYVLLGLGMAITVAPLTTTVMGAVGDQYSGTASGINNAVARVAGLLAIAVLGIVLLAAFNAALDGRLPALGLPGNVGSAIDAQRTRLAAIELPSDLAPATHAAARAAINDAFTAGFRAAMLICAGLAFASAAVAGAMVGRERPAALDGK